MIRSTLTVAALALAMPAYANPDLDALRAEIAAMKSSYETRIQALEFRLQASEAKTDDRLPTPDAPASPGESVQSASNGFNPDISLILQGRYTQAKALPERSITGFLSNGEAAPTTRGFSVNESELVMSANIDPSFRGYINATLNDDAIGVEEAWVQTLALGQGFSLKAGRFRSGIGYQNEQHPHAWDFATNNLMYDALFGEGYGNDGLQLKWVAPTDLFTELGAEIGRGASFPGTNRNRNGVGSYTVFGHLGGDVGDSHSWRAGVSYLSAQAEARSGTLADFNDTLVNTSFSGDSTTWLADAVWKWAPQGNASSRNLKLAAELFRRKEKGTLDCDGGLCGAGNIGAYRAVQSGAYAQAVYQFMPRWRAGYRYDLLDPGTRDYGTNNANLARTDFQPTRQSLMVDYSPSEFSRLRLQYTQDSSQAGQQDNQWIMQYIHSLGSHGAHAF